MDEKNKGPCKGPARLARRERERQRHHDEILAAATEVFALHGYDKASMQMIAEEAELSVGKLYMHFQGKEAIYKEIVRHHVDAVIEAADAAVDSDMTPLQMIRARIKASIKHFEEHFEFIRFYFDTNPGEMDEEGKQLDQLFVDIVNDLLQKSAAVSEIRKDIDTLAVAIMMEGAAHRLIEWHAGNNMRDMTRVTAFLDEIFLRPLETGADAGARAEEDE